ncbi:hypothetical protein [Plantactinospora sp. B24E8]|uniref:hypothetical protein n=1 Tax=Plantactinospora sp. B24E8 TaxID=3153567 RepID=UPI00325EDFB9
MTWARSAHHGLTFSVVVTSEEVGAYKPAGAMFRRALDGLGLGPVDQHSSWFR